jgi:hypothetical protein
LKAARLKGVKVMYIFDYMLPTMQLKALFTLTTLILCGLLSAQTPFQILVNTLLNALKAINQPQTTIDINDLPASL